MFIKGCRMIRHNYMIDHASDGQSFKCGEFGADSEILEEFSLDSEVSTGAFLALRVLCESYLLSEVYSHNYCQPAM